MSTGAAIALGILAWVLLAILLGLFLGRAIRLRDQQRPPDLAEPDVGEGPGHDATARSPGRRSDLHRRDGS